MKPTARRFRASFHRLTRGSIAAAALLLLLAPAATRADIDSEVRATLQDRLLRDAAVGVEVIRLKSADKPAVEVYGHDAATPLIPASNLKLATTSAALDHFGPNFRFRTVLLRHGPDLALIGDGDPTFGDAEYLRRVGWETTTVFRSWADRLKQTGVTEVRDVIVDDSIFDQEFFHPHWPGGQAEQHYMAETAGLNFDANLIDLIVEPTSAGAPVACSLDPATKYVSIVNHCLTGARNGVIVERAGDSNVITISGQTPGRGVARISTTIHDPPLYAGQVLVESLESAGIKVTGGVRRDRTERAQRIKAGAAGAAQWPVVAILDTPISAVLARANKDSVNLYAESLCKRLGADVSGATGSWTNGVAAVGAFLKRVGVAPEEFSLDDGCGLSKQDRISPHALTTVLAYDVAGPNRDPFVASLSVAGVDGTLEHRFAGSAMADLRRRLVGKSGFVEGVSTLSGLLHGNDGNWYAFSIMMNGIPHGSNPLVKALQERIVRAIDQSASPG